MAPLLDHLWQSTMVAALMALLTLALQSNSARIRFWLWFAASLKFLVPFAALAALGEALARFLPVTLIAPQRLLASLPAAERFSAPAAILAPQVESAGLTLPLLLGAVWAIGFALVLGVRLVRSLKLRAVLQGARDLDMAGPIRVKTSSSLLEPGLVGIFAPVVLLPQGLLARLSHSEIQSILAHELTHLKRRDNLTAAIHMLVEALFWFYPLVFLAAPAFAQDAASHDQHAHQAPSQPAAPVPDKEMPKMGMKMGMMGSKADMAAHCKMMHEKMTGKDAAKPMDSNMDCHAMHQMMNKPGGATPGH